MKDRTYHNAYMKARRVEAALRGDCAVCCKRPKLPDLSRCAECAARVPDANHAHYTGRGDYRPLDELMELPRIRIMRRLRWLDWTMTITLLDELDVAPGTDRYRFKSALNHAVALGHIDKRRMGTTYEYRITAAGRDYLRQAFNNYEQRLGEGVAA